MELKTVFQSTEPLNRNVIWLQSINGVLIQKVFTTHGWQIVGSPAALPSEYTNTGNSTSNSTNEYIFKISDNPSDLDSNIDTAVDIGLSKTVNVHILGTMNGVQYDTMGVYHNGEISAVQGDTHIVFDVNFDTGVITQHSYYDLSSYIEGVWLDIGNSEETKQSNLEKLRKVTVKTNVFNAHINYGIGVGTWTDGVGGFAHIITAYGHEAYYSISEDGIVVADSDYISPSSLYGEYINNGGKKTKEEFNDELFNLIG